MLLLELPHFISFKKILKIVFMLLICLFFNKIYAENLDFHKHEHSIDACTSFHSIIHANKDAGVTIGNYEKRKDVKAFAQQVSDCFDIDFQWVLKTLQQGKYQASTAKFIMPQPAGTRNWHKFIANFTQTQRINSGVKFWQAHEKWLNQAEREYGVPPKIVLAILGVETIYGQYTGNFRIIDALSTLSFDFPKGRSDRTEFFSNELASFLYFAFNENIDPLSILGSYAGAMGMPQFMPSTLLKYAVDYDKDGSIDLYNSPADIIGSVAHYLAEHQWQRGIPASFPIHSVHATEQQLELLRKPDIIPSFTASEMLGYGVNLKIRPYSKQLSDEVKLSFIELENGPDLPSAYVAGTHNFYVITRYNRSSFYAMAVIEVAQAIETAYQKSKR